MDKSHCKTYLAMDHRLPFTDINLPPCTTGRLANHLMGLALEQGGHTKEIGFSANGGMYMQMTFPKSESGQQFCEKANILIERWLSTTQTHLHLLMTKIRKYCNLVDFAYNLCNKI